MEPLDQSLRFAIRTMTCAFSPLVHLPKQGLLLGRWLTEEERNSFQSLIGGVDKRFVIVVLFIQLLDLAAQNAHTGSPCHAGMTFGLGQRALMFGQCGKESDRRREEALLE